VENPGKSLGKRSPALGELQRSAVLINATIS